MMWWNHGGWGAGDWLAMSFMMVVFWGLLIALVIWLVRSTRSDRVPGRRPAGIPAQPADEVLAERFARGEIDEDEYTRRRALLHSTAGRS
jgi:putative membrane protein